MAEYSHVQFIGINLNTDTVDENGIYKSHPVDERDLWAKTSIVRDLVNNIVERKYRQIPDERATTLKIILFPEFLFRGRRGYYNIELIPKFMNDMSFYFSNSIYSHYVFIMGTLVSGYINLQNKLEIINMSPCFLGGSSERTFVYKEFISLIDFFDKDNIPWDLSDLSTGYHQSAQIFGARSALTPLLAPTTPMLNPVTPTILSGAFSTAETQKYDLMGRLKGGGGYFSFRNVNLLSREPIIFGLEICLDHLYARLATSLALEDSIGAHIQIVPSQGILISEMGDPRRAVCLPGGYIFYVNSGAAPVIALFRNKGVKFKPHINGVSSESITMYETHPELENSFSKIHVLTVRGTMSLFRAMITVFKPQLLPV